MVSLAIVGMSLVASYRTMKNRVDLKIGFIEIFLDTLPDILLSGVLRGASLVLLIEKEWKQSSK